MAEERHRVLPRIQHYFHAHRGEQLGGLPLAEARLLYSIDCGPSGLSDLLKRSRAWGLFIYSGMELYLGAQMKPVLISHATSMTLPAVGPVAAPVGEPVSELKCYEAVSIPEKQVEAGVWECSPGVWHRQVKQAE